MKAPFSILNQKEVAYAHTHIAARTLRQNGMKDEASRMIERITVSGSYDEALCIIGDYVNITGSDEPEMEDFE